MDYRDHCPYCMEEKGGREVCPSCGYSEPESEGPSIFLPPRTVLVEKYLIGRVLGQGGFGITYLAWDINLDIKIAVKEFFPQGLVSRGPTSRDVVTFSGEVRTQFDFGLERFLHEARTLARFADHPNIVTVRDFFRENGTAYMVMNYIEGITLEDYLKLAGGKLKFKETLDIMMPVLDALKEVHLAGILHRDISPDNIFIDSSGRVVLIDFGAARQEMQQKSRGLSVVLKTGYAPEEQYRTRGEQGPWTDVYAAAATMYRAITGQVPLESMDRLAEDALIPPSELGADIEPHQEQALLQAMALRAGDRNRTIEEFQQNLLQEKPMKTEAEDQEVPGETEKTAVDELPAEKKPQLASDRRDEKAAKMEKSAGPAEIPEQLTGRKPQIEQPEQEKKKKTALIAASIIGAVLLLFTGIYFINGGFNGDGAIIPDVSVEEIVITVAAGTEGMELKLTRDLAEMYTAQNEGVRVEVLDTPKLARDRTGLYMEIFEAGSSEVDVFQIDVVSFGDLAEHLVDLYEYGADAVAGDYFPAIIENNTVDGRLVGIPWFTDVGLLYYRTDLLEKYDLSVPETWDDLKEAAQIIQDGERAENPNFWGFVWQGMAYEGLTCNALEWIASNDGGTIISPEGEITINNPNAIEIVDQAAGWVNTISPDGITRMYEEEARAFWQAGNAAFMRNWPYAYSLSQQHGSSVKGLFDVSPLPSGRSGSGAATLGGWHLGVSLYSEYPEVAADVALFMASYEGQKYRAIRGGFNPTIMGLYQDPEVLEAAPYFGSLYDALINAVARPSTITAPHYPAVSELFYNAVYDVLLRRAAAADAFSELEIELANLNDFGEGIPEN